jgi:hypothetical protein
LAPKATTNIVADTYAYDSNGNRTSNGGIANTTGANIRLSSDGTYSYTYDHEGNVVKRVGNRTFIVYS